jgi:hypothetical protein
MLAPYAKVLRCQSLNSNEVPLIQSWILWIDFFTTVQTLAHLHVVGGGVGSDGYIVVP